MFISLTHVIKQKRGKNLSVVICCVPEAIVACAQVYCTAFSSINISVLSRLE